MTSCHISKSVLVGFDEVFLDLWVGGNSGKGKKLQNLCYFWYFFLYFVTADFGKKKAVKTHHRKKIHFIQAQNFFCGQKNLTSLPKSGLVKHYLKRF